MCANITIEESTIDVIISAVTKRMGDINTCAIVSGIRNEKMQKDYAECEKALDVFNKAKESIERGKEMV